MITKEQHYQFLKEHYKHSRFEGRNGIDKAWNANYSRTVANGAYHNLMKYGFAFIGQYESKTGEAIKYNQNLEIIN